MALCCAIFRLFRIPVNPWTLATAGLGGILGLSLLFITMAYNHPFSTNARMAAIYTEPFHELSLLRKILLRMRSWENYAFFESL